MTAALLIDWENFTGRLSEAPYWKAESSEVAPIVLKLVNAIEKHAQGFGVQLTHKRYFIPNNKQVGCSTVLSEAAIQRVESTHAKNAADTRLIVDAVRQAQNGCNTFYVVTGDEDFVDLAIELEEKPGTKCFLCPVDAQRLRGPIQDWRGKLLVTSLIDISHGTAPHAEEMDQFVVYLQRLNDNGRHLGDWNLTVQMLADIVRDLSAEDTERLLTAADQQGLLWRGPVLVQGQAQLRRRLRYENPAVGRLLASADAMLEEIGRRHGSALRGALISTLPPEHTAQYAALPEMLVNAGYMNSAGDFFSFASPVASQGILRPLKRVALSTWHQCKVRAKWEGVGPSILRERWLRHAYPGQTRDLPSDKRDHGLAEGSEMIKRAEVAGLIVPVGGGHTGKPFGYRAQEDHPLVAQAIAAIERIWCLLPADGPTIERPQLLGLLRTASRDCPALGLSEREHLFWLSAMASEQIINMYGGRVQRNRNSPLRALNCDS